MPDDADNSGQGALWEVIGQMQAQIASLASDQPVKPERRASADYAEMEVKWAREDIRDNDSKYSLQFQQQRMRIDELYRRLSTPQDTDATPITPPTVEIVAVTTDGGSGSYPASFTYAFTTADGTAHSGVAPVGNRDAVDLLAGSDGIWKSDGMGGGSLYVLDERPDYSACDDGG